MCDKSVKSGTTEEMKNRIEQRRNTDENSRSLSEKKP